VGVLYRAQQALGILAAHDLTEADFLSSFPSLQGVEGTRIIELAINTLWLEKREHQPLQVTRPGLAILAQADERSRLRQQLHDLIRVQRPTWLGLATRGRQAIARLLDTDTLQCFTDAGLLHDADPHTATWWDEVIRLAREHAELAREQAGRRGEWLSFEYERTRVGFPPRWIALDDATAGYDLLSKQSSGSDQRLLIEVKASVRSLAHATFFVTRNEWLALNSHPNSTFHLWLLSADPPSLLVLPTGDLISHVPQDHGAGTWTEAEFPFSLASAVP
jgi:hypothetical protein